MIFSPRQKLKSLLGRIPARTRIALGQVLLLIGVLFMATVLGIVPSEQQATRLGRSKLCEAIAVHCSMAVERGDVEHLDQSVGALIDRDKNIVGATIRRTDGVTVAKVGDTSSAAPSAAREKISVPIWSNQERWGAIELQYKLLAGHGLIAELTSPQMRLVAFVAAACTALFLLYLRKTLKHLDPSKVVPPRVRSALDTLAEGLLVVDNESRVMLANQAFASITGGTPEMLMGATSENSPG